MKTLGASLLCFFFAYVPSTAVIGLLVGSFQAPGIQRSFSYEFFLWFVVAVQLLGPTLVTFLIVVALLKFFNKHLVAFSNLMAPRLMLAVVLGVSLPSVQALCWGGQQISIHWFAVSVVPAAALGFLLIQTKTQLQE